MSRSRVRRSPTIPGLTFSVWESREDSRTITACVLPTAINRWLQGVHCRAAALQLYYVTREGSPPSGIEKGYMMPINDLMNLLIHMENLEGTLTVVQLGAGENIPPHSHTEGYVVIPLSPATGERSTHESGRVIKREPLVLYPLVPYYVEPTEKNQTISIRNTGGVSAFQKYVPNFPINGPQPELRTQPLTIISHGSNRQIFTVEIAVTFFEKAIGLMFRPRLAPDHGMLFVWLWPRRVAMYMRNTLIPLDLLFIDQAFRISQIHANAAPGDTTPIVSKEDVIFTLELPGGTTARLGIKEGDTIQ